MVLVNFSRLAASWKSERVCLLLFTLCLFPLNLLWNTGFSSKAFFGLSLGCWGHVWDQVTDAQEETLWRRRWSFEEDDGALCWPHSDRAEARRLTLFAVYRWNLPLRNVITLSVPQKRPLDARSCSKVVDNLNLSDNPELLLVFGRLRACCVDHKSCLTCTCHPGTVVDPGWWCSRETGPARCLPLVDKRCTAPRHHLIPLPVSSASLLGETKLEKAAVALLDSRTRLPALGDVSQSGVGVIDAPAARRRRVGKVHRLLHFALCWSLVPGKMSSTAFITSVRSQQCRRCFHRHPAPLRPPVATADCERAIRGAASERNLRPAAASVDR